MDKEAMNTYPYPNELKVIIAPIEEIKRFEQIVNNLETVLQELLLVAIEIKPVRNND